MSAWPHLSQDVVFAMFSSMKECMEALGSMPEKADPVKLVVISQCDLQECRTLE